MKGESGREAIRSTLLRARSGDLAIIGDPVEHSLSPAMHNAAFQAVASQLNHPTKLPTYHAVRVHPDDLSFAVGLIKERGLSGFNITVPHKETAIAQLDQVDVFARKVGAVNTVKKVGSNLHAFNTDAAGFARAVQQDLRFRVDGRAALVFGAGGTGVVLTHKLIDLGARKVFWWNRNPGRLQNQLKKFAKGAPITPLDSAPALKAAFEEAELVVNATAVGLTGDEGLPQLLFYSRHSVFDVIYHRRTAFVDQALKAGARVNGGLGMLLYQGAEAFAIWTGLKAPLDVMERALIQELRNRGIEPIWRFGT